MWDEERCCRRLRESLVADPLPAEAGEPWLAELADGGRRDTEHDAGGCRLCEAERVDGDHAEALLEDEDRAGAAARAGEDALRRSVGAYMDAERRASRALGAPVWGVAWTYPDDCQDVSGRLRCLFCHECVYYAEEHRADAVVLMRAHVEMCREVRS